MTEYEYGVQSKFISTGSIYGEWKVGELADAMEVVVDRMAAEEHYVELGDIDERTRCTFSVIRRTKPVAAGPWEPYDPA